MGQEGRRSGVGVMKDKEVKLEEIETSLTLGGAGEGRFQARRGEGSGEGLDTTRLSDTQ
jgi:hypothetical protein